MLNRNRKTLTLSLTGQIARYSAQLEQLTGEQLDRDNIVPLVATGVRAKTAGRIARQRKTAEKNSLPVSQWTSNRGGEPYTVGELLESDTGRKHLETQCVRAERRAETDLRRASEIRSELQRAQSAKIAELESEIATLKSDR